MSNLAEHVLNNKTECLQSYWDKSAYVKAAEALAEEVMKLRAVKQAAIELVDGPLIPCTAFERQATRLIEALQDADGLPRTRT